MISRLLTCFSLALGVVCLLTGLAPAATILGRVVIVPAKAGSPRIGDAATVVWLSALDSATAEPVSLPDSLHARMLQTHKHFVPHVLAVQVGTSVDFPNADPIFHNAFSNFDGQLFDIGLYPPGSSRSIRFRRAGVVRVFCNIHASMSAVIVVLPTPYFTLTRDNGAFIIPNVPPGRYRLHFFYERATSETLDALERTINPTNPASDLGAVTISEAGYIPPPHKNKFGHDYPPGSPDVYR